MKGKEGASTKGCCQLHPAAQAICEMDGSSQNCPGESVAHSCPWDSP